VEVEEAGVRVVRRTGLVSEVEGEAEELELSLMDMEGVVEVLPV